MEDLSTKDVSTRPVSLILPKDLYFRIKQLALENDVSFNKYVKTILEERIYGAPGRSARNGSD